MLSVRTRPVHGCHVAVRGRVLAIWPFTTTWQRGGGVAFWLRMRPFRSCHVVVGGRGRILDQNVTLRELPRGSRGRVAFWPRTWPFWPLLPLLHVAWCNSAGRFLLHMAAFGWLPMDRPIQPLMRKLQKCPQTHWFKARWSFTCPPFRILFWSWSSSCSFTLLCYFFLQISFSRGPEIPKLIFLLLFHFLVLFVFANFVFKEARNYCMIYFFQNWWKV